MGHGFVLNAAINFRKLLNVKRNFRMFFSKAVSSCSQQDNLYRCRNSYCISNIFNCDHRNWCGDDTQLFVCR